MTIACRSMTDRDDVKLTPCIRQQVMFMRQWFANQEVEEFSIAVWVKRAPGGNTKANIVQNGVCESPSFHVTSEGGELYGGIKTDSELTLEGDAVTKHTALRSIKIICCTFDKSDELCT